MTTPADFTATQVKRVGKWSDKLLSSSPRITFLMGELRKKGVENVFIQCLNCSQSIPTTSKKGLEKEPNFDLNLKPKDNKKDTMSSFSGGFSPSKGILVCAETVDSKSTLEDILAHELLHAYDNATIKDFSMLNLRHLACSEIRAVNTSGECRFSREIRRGYFGIAKHHQDCVKRRAILGVVQSGKVNEKEAERAVLNAWPFCFPDTAPYEEIY